MIAFDTSLCELAAAQTREHDGTPAGVPESWSWARRATIEAGNTPPQGFRALQGWGQVFGADQIEIRGFQTWALAANKWRKVQSGAWDGAAFRPDYAGNENVPATREGALVTIQQDRAYHWWFDLKAAIPRKFNAVLVLCQARGTPGALVGLGCDYWRAKDSSWQGLDVANRGVGVGQLRRLTNNWRTYGFTTATVDDFAEWSGQ